MQQDETYVVPQHVDLLRLFLHPNAGLYMFLAQRVQRFLHLDEHLVLVRHRRRVAVAEGW